MGNQVEKSDWLFCTLADIGEISFSSDPYCLGQYELSRHAEAFPQGEDALRRSAVDHSLSIGHRIFRLRAFFYDETAQEVSERGVLYAREMLGLLPYAIFLPGAPRLLPAGYLLNLCTGEAVPFLRKARERTAHLFGVVGVLDRHAISPALIINSLLSVKPSHYGELGQAVRRSTHWGRLATEAVDYGEKLLNQWMACETLTRELESEDLRPKFLAVLGFPASRYYQALAQGERDALAAVPGYDIWRKRLNKTLDDLRIARNHIAHSGYRELDLAGFFPGAEISLVRRAMPLVLSKLQRLALSALELRITTVREMWCRFAECVVLHREGRPLASDTEGQVVFSLSHDDSVFT